MKLLTLSVQHTEIFMSSFEDSFGSDHLFRVFCLRKVETKWLEGGQKCFVGSSPGLTGVTHAHEG